MFFVIYEFVLHLFALLMLPKLCYRYFVKKRYHNSLALRLGIGYPLLKKDSRFCIWVHAVSVGEAKAVKPLVEKMRALYPDSRIIVSSITETGHAEAKRSLGCADEHVYLPFDFSYVVGPIIRRLSPDLVLLTETDFWFNFQRHAKLCGARLVLVNGKISQTSLRRHQQLPFLASPLFSPFDKFCLQSQTYFDRFKKIGVPVEKMVVTGNLKLDDDYPFLSKDELVAFKERLGVKGMSLVIGSTHAPEEKDILFQIQAVWERYPTLKVILVPRHPDRIAEVEAIVRSFGISYVRYSELAKSSGEEQLVLIDQMGLLRDCYQVARVAIVAGSYTPKVGGHNILEPLWYDVPVLYGPHMHSQPEFVELMEEFKAGKQEGLEGLQEQLVHLLESDSSRAQMAEAGKRLLASAKGATERTSEVIVSCILLQDKQDS